MQEDMQEESCHVQEVPSLEGKLTEGESSKIEDEESLFWAFSSESLAFSLHAFQREQTRLPEERLVSSLIS
jgi:hypothetical protein